MRRFFLSLALAVWAGPLPAGELVVRPNPALVQAGAAVSFTVAADTAPDKVEWQVVPPGLGTMDDGGLFTASERPGRGLVRALATTRSGARSVGHAMVSVLPAGDRRLKVTVAPATARVVLNSSVQYQADVGDMAGGEAGGLELTWRVVPRDLGTVDARGLFTPRRTGLGRIVALARAEQSQGMGQARVAVVPAKSSGSLIVHLEPARLRLEPEASVQIKVTVTDAGGRPVPAAVGYQVSPAGLGTVSTGGILTASSSPGHGALTVRADHQGAVGQARGLVVVAHEVKRYRVQLRPKAAAIAPSQSAEFEPVCYDAQGNQARPPYWVWKVLPKGLGTITPEGLFTAGDRVIQGKVVVSLPPEFGQGQDFASVRVRPGRPKVVRVSPAKALLKPGETRQFSASVVGTQGQAADNARFIWKVSPERLGTITPDGLFTAGPLPRMGTVVAIIPPEYGGGKGYAVIGVSNYTVQILGARPRHLTAGETHQFQADVRDQNGNPVPGVVLVWSASSLSPNFGTIDPSSGLFSAGTPLAQQVEGIVLVRVRLNDHLVGGDGIKVIVHRP